MVKTSAYLKVEKRQPLNSDYRKGFPVVEELCLSLREDSEEREKVLATLCPIPRVLRDRASTLEVLPIDRALAWEELTRWIEYLFIFPDPEVQEKQYENRLKLEGAQFFLRERPAEQELYDWRIDEPLLQKIRSRYASVIETMCAVVGNPRKEDFDRLYPNPYEDEGVSDQARWVLRSVKAAFGKDILALGTQ
ncbi:hypothetical protein HY230_03390 [Candidatus Acetothermia bacterium]|nr:hypothetical protein [Candidatus Acetothermia bacterium]MBI3659500.1 hypothetical protein [Candidatus Acetothermia bacterium]